MSLPLPPAPMRAPHICQQPWCSEPGSHRWLGARVAWPFGDETYAGTCLGWKRDSLLGYFVWFVSYDDGDTEVYNVAHMRCGIRLFREMQAPKKHRPSPKVKPSLEVTPVPEPEVTPKPGPHVTTPVPEAASPRRWSPPGMLCAARSSRRPVDPDQALYPFPVLVAPRRLQEAPDSSGRPGPKPSRTLRPRKLEDGCETTPKRARRSPR